MEFDRAEQRYYDYLNTLPLSTLRILGREKGVSHASSNSKQVLIEEIINILTGKQEPAPRNNRGAPAKQSYINPDIFEKLDEIRRETRNEEEEWDGILRVASGDLTPSSYDQPIYTGILEITQGGYGFVRAHNCQPSSKGEDVFLPAPLIHSMGLREGDFISCTAKVRQRNEAAAVEEVLGVNGNPAKESGRRPEFDALTARYADRKLDLSLDSAAPSLRLLDLFVPIGRGQRALIVAPPKAGKTTLIKEIARAVSRQYREIVLIVLLIDERPEEVTDLRESVPDAMVVSSTFDEDAEHHVRAARLALEHARRNAELGRDVVILLDSLTKLTRAWNSLMDNGGKILTGGLDVRALAEPKRFFGTARATKEAGSVTILASVLVETGSRMDDVIYEEFKGTGNADIVLSRELAERRIFPAIDLRRSGTRREELLLTPEEVSAVRSMRENGLTADMPALLDLLRRTQDNEELLLRLSDMTPGRRS